MWVNQMEIAMQTIGQVKKLIKEAKVVCIQPRFGLCENWFKISKKEAYAILERYEDSCYLNDLEIGDIEIVDGVLYLG